MRCGRANSKVLSCTHSPSNKIVSLSLFLAMVWLIEKGLLKIYEKFNVSLVFVSLCCASTFLYPVCCALLHISVFLLHIVLFALLLLPAHEESNLRQATQGGRPIAAYSSNSLANSASFVLCSHSHLNRGNTAKKKQ